MQRQAADYLEGQLLGRKDQRLGQYRVGLQRQLVYPHALQLGKDLLRRGDLDREPRLVPGHLAPG